MGGSLKRAIYGASTLESVIRRTDKCYTEESNCITTIVSRALGAAEERDGMWTLGCETFARYCKTGKFSTGLHHHHHHEELHKSSTSTKLVSTATGSMIGAGVGFAIGGPIGGLVGSVVGAVTASRVAH